jgi:hypothetical protein
MKSVLLASSALIGSLILVGCGVNQKPAASGTPPISTSRSTGVLTPSAPASQSSRSPSPGSSAPTTSSTPPTSPSTPTSTEVAMVHIQYSPTQQAKIVDVAKHAGFGSAFVPEQGFATRFASVRVYQTSSTPSHPVLELGYTNVLVQEVSVASALTGGGDQQSSKVSLVIPSSGSNRSETGTWTEVYGNQGSATRGVVTFSIHGVTIQVASSTLSKSQLIRMAESFAQL